MFPANAFTIRYAGADDAETLRRLAELDSRSALTGPVVLAEDDGVAIAAFSMADGRTVADPFRHTARALVHLRMRANALAAYDRAPTVRERIRAAVIVRPHTPAHDRG
jgi:hypothetical protein